jgi:hypothetical protein
MRYAIEDMDRLACISAPSAAEDVRIIPYTKIKGITIVMVFSLFMTTLSQTFMPLFGASKTPDRGREQREASDPSSSFKDAGRVNSIRCGNYPLFLLLPPNNHHSAPSW